MDTIQDLVVTAPVAPNSNNTEALEKVMGNSGPISSEDTARIDRNAKIKDEIIGKLTKDGVPEDGRSVRLLLEVMDSQENSIYDKAKVANDDTANKAAMVEATSALISKINQDTSKPAEAKARDIMLDNEEDITDAELVEDELSINPGELTLVDIKT